MNKWSLSWNLKCFDVEKIIKNFELDDEQKNVWTNNRRQLCGSSHNALANIYQDFETISVFFNGFNDLKKMTVN